MPHAGELSLHPSSFQRLHCSYLASNAPELVNLPDSYFKQVRMMACWCCLIVDGHRSRDERRAVTFR